MIVVYSNHSIPAKAFDGHSLFLGGPTPRNANVQSWRPEALDILRSFSYKGHVLVPEWDNFNHQVDYLTQVGWERTGLMNVTRVVLWVPREMTNMPALTTNIEFGYYLARRPDAVLYGRPEWASHCKYLDWLYTLDTGRTPFNNLKLLLEEATKIA